MTRISKITLSLLLIFLITRRVVTKVIMVNYTQSACEDIQFKEMPTPSMELILQKSYCNVAEDESKWDTTSVKLDKVKKIDLIMAGVQKLPGNFFCDLPTVTEVQFISNRLTEVVHLGFGLNNSCGHSLEVLHLILNNLTVLRNDSFPCTLKRLHNLDLKYNGIHTVESGAFVCLEKLEYLNLESNKLTTINPETFCHNVVLKELNLSYNNLSNFRITCNKPSHIEVLDLGHNAFESIPKETLHGMINLTTLILEYNNIGELNTDSFADLHKLQLLIINDNKISSIEENIFDNVNELQLVNLRYNKLEHVSTHTFANVTLARLDLSDNTLARLNLQLKTEKKANLDFKRNNLTRVAITSDDALSDRAVDWQVSLNLQINKIEALTIQDVNLTGIIGTLVTMDFSYNQIAFIDPSFFRRASVLQIVHLRNNQLTTVPLFLQEPRPYKIALANNPLLCDCYLGAIADFDGFLFSSHTVKLESRQGVTCRRVFGRHRNQTLELTSKLTFETDFLCSINLPLNQQAFSNVTKFGPFNFPLATLKCLIGCSCYTNFDMYWNFIDCSGRNFTEIPKYEKKLVDRVAYMHTLILSQNLIKNLVINHTYFETLVELDLDYNELHSIDANAFLLLTQLQNLFLQHNRLESLPKGVFSTLARLEILDLSHNHLFDLDDHLFNSQTLLRELHLNGNNMTQYRVWSLPTNLQLLRLHDNPWSCDCDYAANFTKWMTKYSGTIKDRDTLNCLPNDTSSEKIFFSEYNSSRCMPQLKIFTKIKPTPEYSLLIVSLSVVVVIVTVVTFVFVYRREMQVLIYSRYGVRWFYQSDNDGDENKPFDAFVSYSSQDEEFVIRDLLPGLENIEEPYKVCLHHRNFLAGSYIGENIVRAIDGSRRTILVVSDNFVHSVWCRDEFRVAHTKMLEDRRCRVIVLLINGIPEMPFPELKHYLRTYTYLRWNESLFWEKLYFAMPEKRTKDSLQQGETFL